VVVDVLVLTLVLVVVLALVRRRLGALAVRRCLDLDRVLACQSVLLAHRSIMAGSRPAVG
jgi:hypothetical protein